MTRYFLILPLLAIIAQVVELEARSTQTKSAGPVGIYEGGADYLPLEEDDEEFPEESIRMLRTMAASFRSGLAGALSQGGAAADGLAGAGGDGEDGGGEGGGAGPGGQVMKYIQQIMKGFQTMRKSISEMFQQIAAFGGQRLASRIQDRLGRWAKQGASQAQSVAGQAQGAVEGASAAKPFRRR